ncbi:MAG: sulfatase [Solirubrobacterales bacterium]
MTAACVLTLLVLAMLVAAGRAPAAVESRPRPSFVVIQTDDQTLDQLYAAFTPISGVTYDAMPNTLALIADRGVTFNRYYTPYSLCGPSRASLLTGRYAHSNGVRGNVPPNGGNTGFESRPANTHNIATWLQAAGYRTIHVGKYLNGYGDAPYSTGENVPPGWTVWNTVLNTDTDHYFYGYRLNNNGVVEGPYGDSGSWETREYGERDDFGCPTAPLNGKPCYYQTDVLSEIAANDVWATSPEQPFYLQLDYTAPHGDYRRPAGPEPPIRYYETFDGAPYPHNASQGFNEGNVNDKPRFIREAPYLSPAEIHTYRVYYDKALASLRAIDDGVKRLYDTLGAMHRLRNTYIIFTSDNGFFYGEHRLTGGKFLAYEPSTHLPLLMRGPGIKPGTETGQLASTIDIAPTILELAEVEPDKSVDGTSLYPFAHDPSLRTRRPLLFESFVQTSDVEEEGGTRPITPAKAASAALRARPGSAQRGGGEDASAHASIVAPPKNYYGIRLGPYKYIEWPDGEKELYDITKDPYELNNIVRDPNYFPIRAFLHRELVRLETCHAAVCREVSEKMPLTKKEQLRIKRKHEKEQREREREREKKEKEREKKHHK